MFLGVAANVGAWGQEDSEFSLYLDDNPLVDFVELPDEIRSLKYCNILCGVVRGALEMVNMRVECDYVRCTLWGDETLEIRVRLYAPPRTVSSPLACLLSLSVGSPLGRVHCLTAHQLSKCSECDCASRPFVCLANAWLPTL